MPWVHFWINVTVNNTVFLYYLCGHCEEGGHPQGNSSRHWPTVQPERDLQQYLFKESVRMSTKRRPVQVYIYICLIMNGRDSKWDSPMKRWRAYKRGRRLWGGSRRTLSWTPSGSAKEGGIWCKTKPCWYPWSAPWDSCILLCWSLYCNRLSQKAPTWTWRVVLAINIIGFGFSSECPISFTWEG